MATKIRGSNFSPSATTTITSIVTENSLDSSGVIALVDSDYIKTVQYGDNEALLFGDGSDLKIFHSGTHSFINDIGTGNLYIAGSSRVELNKAGTSEKMIAAIADGAVELYHDNVKKFETTSTGATVTGEVVADSATINIISVPDGGATGNRINIGSSDDLKIYHDGSHSWIRDQGTGHLYITTDGDFISLGSGGAQSFGKFTSNEVELYYNSSKKLETTATGATVTGTINADSATIPVLSGDITMDGALRGPSTFYIDPAPVDSDAGLLVIRGDLQVDGTTTTVNSTTVSINDKNIVLADSAANASEADGAGITVNGASATIQYDAVADAWDFNKDIDVTGTVTADGVINNNKSEFFGSENALVSTGSTAKVYATSTTFDGVNGSLVLQSRPTAGADVYIATGATPKKVAKFDDGGDISFYDNTGTTQGFFWDASGQVLALGHTSPSSSYSIDAQKGIRVIGNAPNYTLREDDASNQTWLMASYGGTFAVRDTTVAGTSYPLQIQAAAPTGSLFITSGGNVGIGTTSPSAQLQIDAAGSVSDGSGRPTIILNNTSSGGWTSGTEYGSLEFHSDDTTSGAGLRAKISATTGGTNGSRGRLSFTTRDAAGATVEAMNITESGVGIGETAPANLLHVKESDTGIAPHASAQIVLEREGTNYLQFLTAETGTSGILFGDGSDVDVAQIKYDHNTTTMLFVTEASEAMRIDSGGNLLVGNTSNNTTQAGVYLNSSGRFFATHSGSSSIFNRLSTDGDILLFQKDTSTVGRIGSTSYADAFIAGASTGIAFGGTNVTPTTNTGAISDNAKNLGGPSARWQNAYFSGEVQAQFFTGNGDTDTYMDISSNPANTIKFYTGGSERLRIDSSGNVGIGAAPGSARFLATGGQSQFRYDHTTTSVSGNTNETAFPHAVSISNQQGGADTNLVSLGLSVYTTGSVSNGAIVGHSTAAGSMDLAFYTESSNVINERVRITSGGNVGIGTTSPSNKLSVEAGSNPAISVTETGAGAVILQGTGSGGRVYSNSGNKLLLGANGQNSHLIVDTGGNVGIGTTSPSYQLDVSGDINFTGDLRQNGNVVSAVQIAIFERNATSVQSAGAFRDRNFQSLVSNTISGVSLNGSGYAVIPAGTYLVQYFTTIIYDPSAPGETLSRLYDHASSAVVPNSYSIRGTQAADGTDSVYHSGMVYVTWGSTVNIGLQTLTENNSFQDVNTFDNSPGNTLPAADARKSTQLLIWKLS